MDPIVLILLLLVLGALLAFVLGRITLQALLAVGIVVVILIVILRYLP